MCHKDAHYQEAMLWLKNIFNKTRNNVVIFNKHHNLFKFVYWSDLQERNIQRARLDGSDHQVVLNISHGIGFVDGRYNMIRLGGLAGILLP